MENWMGRASVYSLVLKRCPLKETHVEQGCSHSIIPCMFSPWLGAAGEHVLDVRVLWPRCDSTNWENDMSRDLGMQGVH